MRSANNQNSRHSILQGAPSFAYVEGWALSIERPKLSSSKPPTESCISLCPLRPCVPCSSWFPMLSYSLPFAGPWSLLPFLTPPPHSATYPPHTPLSQSSSPPAVPRPPLLPAPASTPLPAPRPPPLSLSLAHARSPAPQSRLPHPSPVPH